MSGTVRCKIVCLHCKRSEEWDDEAPDFSRGLGNPFLHHVVNRSPPAGWILGPDQPFSGQLSESARGICAACRQFALDFNDSERPSLWNLRFNVEATEPGVFDVSRDDGTRFGQVRLGCRGAFLAPTADAPMDVLAEIAGEIGQRFAFP